MTNYSSASSGVNGIPQQMDNYLSSSIAVLLDAAPLQTQLPVPIPSRADYAADYPFERNSALYVVRSPPPVFQHAEAPAMVHSFQTRKDLALESRPEIMITGLWAHKLTCTLYKSTNRNHMQYLTSHSTTMT